MKEEKSALLLLTLSSKKCSCCGEVKPTTEFTRLNNHGKKWGFQPCCKECHNKKIKKYRKDNQEKYKRLKRNQELKKKYGLTIEDAEIILKNQNYKCAICGKELILFGDIENRKKGIANVDHNHATGEIRGLLCDKCNRGLGCFDDNTDYLLSAISYLKKNK